MRKPLLLHILLSVLACLTLAQCLAACRPDTSVKTEKRSLTEIAIPANTQTPIPLTRAFPLAETGSYSVGVKRGISLVDPARDMRPVNLSIWYPSQPDPANPDQLVMYDGNPDLSAAPYPMILSSTKVANIFAPHLVSHGFTWVGVDDIDTWDIWGREIIHQPLDLLFALNTVASEPIEKFAGVINTENVGSIGYSFDALNSLFLGGARVDEGAYLLNCSNTESMENPPEDWWINYCCDLSEEWEDFSTWVGEGITSGPDGLWNPLTDTRIKAFMPMAPEGAWLFNQRGLAAIEKPVMVIAAEKDTINYYDLEAVFIFDHLGASEKSMITFPNRGHMMIYTPDDVTRMKHLAVAFFGYYLQGKEEYKYYFSEDFINQQDGLFWGAVR